MKNIDIAKWRAAAQAAVDAGAGHWEGPDYFHGVPVSLTIPAWVLLYFIDHVDTSQT